jgi:hypothetical protein
MHWALHRSIIIRFNDDGQNATFDIPLRAACVALDSDFFKRTYENIRRDKFDLLM